MQINKTGKRDVGRHTAHAKPGGKVSKLALIATFKLVNKAQEAVALSFSLYLMG